MLLDCTITKSYCFVIQSSRRPFNVLSSPSPLTQVSSKSYFSASAFFELTPVVGNLVNIHPKFGVDFVYYLDNPFENESRYKITIAGMFTF